MEPEGSLPHSQELSTFLYPEQDQFSPHHTILSLQHPYTCYPPTHDLVFLVSLSLCLFYSKVYTALIFRIRTTCPAHLILLDLVILVILGEDQK
jgi:hypothetical protein